MSKKLIITICIALLVAAGTILAYGYGNAIQPRYLHENPDEEVCAVYPYENGILRVGDSLRFRIDTGSRISLIRQADIDLLKRRKVPIDSIWYPSIGKNIHGEFYFTTKRYIASLPIKERKLVTDSATGRQYYTIPGKVVNRIMNVAFLAADPNDSVSTLGINLLEHFVVEYQNSREAVVLRKSVPLDYQLVSHIDAPFSIYKLLGISGKYYLDVTADNAVKPYCIDTGIEEIDLKLPSEDAKAQPFKSLRERKVRTTRGEITAQYTDSLWVRLGNRQGTHSAYFSGGEEEEYCINPMNFYTQDFVLDFPARKLYLHPTARR